MPFLRVNLAVSRERNVCSMKKRVVSLILALCTVFSVALDTVVYADGGSGEKGVLPVAFDGFAGNRLVVRPRHPADA